MIPYGKRLVKLRRDKSQSEVANAIGIAASTLGMYEAERRVPRDNIKIALANYYGTTVQAIFFDEECLEKEHRYLEPVKKVV